MVLNVLAVLLATPPCPALGPAPACDGALPVYEAGCAQRWICPAEVESAGLTRVDLSDAWLPAIFQAGTDAQQPYRAIYRKLAAGAVTDDAVEGRAATDQFFETYGVFPNLTQVRDRLLDSKRHTCRDAVDDTVLAGLERVISAYEPPEKQRKRVATVRDLERRFRRELTKRAKKANPDAEVPAFGAADFETLAEEKRWAWGIRKWRRVRVNVEAVRATQEHLKCEGLLEKIRRPGLFDYRTQLPLQAFQRKLMLGSRSHLDAETRESLVADSRTTDYRALLRALRERVAEATGLIEDGSALGEWGTVFGEQLDTKEYRHPLHGVPVEGGARDYLAPATEAAAGALGWTSPETTIERLATLKDLGSLQIAVKLPPPPPWHADHMTLRAEVDRGDVWYDYPVTADGKKRRQPVTRRPHLTLYAQHGEREVALIRWPTTIGSWKTEQDETGATVYKYKNSDVGPRFWRTLVAGPSWLPPKTTPIEDLVERVRGRYRAKQDLFGPSYASAYGLVMLIHEQRFETRKGEVKWWDRGIRVHGSVGYRSIVRGSSHGCHRLFNHLAVRLGSFVLRHRKHTVEGPIEARYRRTFTYKGRRISIHLPSRGFGYSLDPPVPVEVLRGRVRGRTRKVPTAARPVP